ncbi:unnamed protein product [Orchesella dallaii]|uniref:Gustatory receptor n=1 Tax=Orchesella dallaii TaxID=48710 RepID=A0ABP1PKX5_9HEXA
MPSCISGTCNFGRAHTVIDIELHGETNNEIGSEVSDPSVLVISEISPRSADPSQRCNYVEIWLNFFYFIGVTPFRVDYKRRLRSFCINKLISILIKALAIVYIIFNIRRLTWSLDDEDQTQQDRASSCIGLVNQFCSLLLHASLLRMVWCKQSDFLQLLKLQDCTDAKANSIKKSYLGDFLVISLCIFTVFVSLLCSVGGLSVWSWIDAWSFTEILWHNEDMFLFSLKKFNEYNESTLINSTGIFIDNGQLETIIIGSTGITMNFCKLIDSFYSHDCLLLCSISLWLSTKPLRDQLALWEIRRRENLDCETEGRNLAEDLLKKHKELNLLSKQMNTIINCFLPVLSMTSMINMSYFMHICVIRDWFFALYLALRLGKVCIAISFAMKISKVAATYNSWFISEKVQGVLELSAKEFQRQVTEMNQEPFGIGNGVFYIDTRFLLNALGLIITYYIMLIVG